MCKFRNARQPVLPFTGAMATALFPLFVTVEQQLHRRFFLLNAISRICDENIV
jgi:hypothetical protein